MLLPDDVVMTDDGRLGQIFGDPFTTKALVSFVGGELDFVEKSKLTQMLVVPAESNVTKFIEDRHNWLNRHGKISIEQIEAQARKEIDIIEASIKPSRAAYVVTNRDVWCYILSECGTEKPIVTRDAKAMCSHNDTFSATIGKYVALSRAAGYPIRGILYEAIFK